MAALGAVIAAMIGLVAYSPTLYRMFCELTGFGGTTQRADAATASTADRTITVRFTTEIARDLPWRFEPEQREVTVRLGARMPIRVLDPATRRDIIAYLKGNEQPSVAAGTVVKSP